MLYFSKDIHKELRSWLAEKYVRCRDHDHVYALGLEEQSMDMLTQVLREGLGGSFPEELCCWRMQWELKCASLLRWHITEGMRTEALQNTRSTFFDRVDEKVAVGQSCLSFRMSGAACKREHVVPCNMLTSKAIEMIDDGVSGLFEATIQWTATLKYIIAPQIFQALSGLLASTISLGKVCLAGFQSMPISGQGPLRWS